MLKVWIFKMHIFVEVKYKYSITTVLSIFRLLQLPLSIIILLVHYNLIGPLNVMRQRFIGSRHSYLRPPTL